MTFRKVAKDRQSGGTGPTIDWSAFNDHLEAQIDAAIEEEGANQVCILSGIIDAGTQPPNEEYSEYDYVGDERQEKLLANDKVDCYVENGKFYKANRPVDSVVFLVDFPGIMINYGQFLSKDQEDDWRPYRAVIGGEFKGIAAVTSISPSEEDGYGAKSRVYKLAKAMGLFTKTNPPADFDLGELLGGVFTMDVEVKRGGDQNQYLNIVTKNIGAKNKRLPVPDNDIVPFGIMMDGGNDPDTLKLIKKSVMKRLEMASEWEESELKKEIEAAAEARKEEAKANKDDAPAKAKDATKAKAASQKAKKPASSKPKQAKQEVAEPEADFDDDIPF